MPKRRALGADLVIPLLALAFTVYFLVSIAGLGWEASANGIIVGTVLILLVGVQLVRVGLAVRAGRATAGFGPLLEPRDALGKRVGMLLIAIAFVATVRWLGLGLGLFIALAAALAVMGVRGLGRIVAISFCVAFAATLVFVVALDSSLPRGPVEKLIMDLRR